jgi:hypothetical protein
MDICESRQNEFNIVSGWLNSAPKPGQVDIYGISGYGGIGKSYLLNQVLSSVKPAKNGYLQVTIDGTDASIIGDFMALYDRKFSPKTIPLGKVGYDYFPQARKIVEKYDVLNTDVKTKLNKSEVPVNEKTAAELIFRAGGILNMVIPATEKFINFESLQRLGLDKTINNASKLLDDVINDRSLLGCLPVPIKNALGMTKSERLRTDLYRLCADMWFADISAILNGSRGKNRFKLFNSPINELNRLFLIIDDFESLGKTIIDFFSAALVPVLQQANFHSTVIILGRDDLSDAHVSFQQHLAPIVRKKIRLERFTDEVAQQMFQNAGYSEEDIPKLMSDSQRYPFLVNLLCEVKNGGVSFYQQFYDRTTRWMSQIEKEWVLPLCYLDQINQATIQAMLPHAPASVVMEWFKREASLRDPNAEWYSIAPYIQRTLREYHRKELSDSEYCKFLERGKSASKQA